MKSLLIALMLVGSAHASTIISTPFVSGTWTLAGSPYLVQNDITVGYGSTLNIQSNVVVKFVPQSNMTIAGALIAKSVTFEAIDTTGWANQSTTAGGWNGIHFMSISTIDVSKFKSNTIKDCKYGYNSYVPYSNAFTCLRTLDISGCVFYHNTSGTGMYSAGDVIYLSTTYPTDNIKFQACNVHHNSGPFGIVRSTNYNGGKTDIVKNMIAYNKIGAPIWGTYNNLLIQDNDIFKNDALLDNSPIKLSVGHAIVRGNRVYANTCQHLAAVGCRSGSVLIEENLICNNSQYDGGCGLLGGGGGIHLAYNENPAAESFDSTYYIVRNNVIANNYSGWGGGGIYVYNVRATISNNHVVNNTAPMGNAMLINSALSQVYAKSNLFFGISPGGVKDSLNIIWVQSADTILFDYNYIPAIYGNAVLSLSGYGCGDVSHNVIGTNPQMLNPTADNNVGTSAISKDFSITGASPCIDYGDTTGVYPAPIDFTGTARVINSVVDIGAFEYDPTMFFRSSGLNEMERFEALIYPNPSNGAFTVQTSSTGPAMLFGINGELIGTYPVNEQIAVNVAPGIYFVEIQGSAYKLIVK